MKNNYTNVQYVDNVAFFDALQERRILVAEANESGTPLPRVSEYLGDCIFKIATNFAHLRSFNGYQFKDDMILDGVESCLKAIDKFDDKITHNPFAYFTQIVYFAFLQRIAKEKKQVYIRSKILTSNMLDLTELQSHDEQGEFTNNYIEYMKSFNNFDGSAFEKPKKEKVTKEVISPLDEFYGTV